MKITPVNLSVEQFPEQNSWIGKLFSTLNQFTGEVVRGVQNSVTVEDNLLQEIKEIKYVNTNSNFPLKFSTKFKNIQPRGLMPIYLLDNTTGAYATQQPWVQWSYQNNEVRISDISGLTANSTYTIRLLVIYG